jgi:phosphatidylinositol alpha-1,6-mannosyltransferase
MSHQSALLPASSEPETHEAHAALDFPSSLLVARDYFPPQIGGISTMMERLVAHAGSPNLRCVVGMPGASHVATLQGRARVYRTAAAFRLLTPFDSVVMGGLLAALKLRHQVRALILATGAEGHVGLLARRVLGLPFITFAHGNEILTLRKTEWPRPLAAVRSASAVLANSRYTAGLLHGLGVAPDRVRVVHPGCDTDRFTHNAAAAAAQRRRFGIQPDSFMLLTVANLVERKGHDMVLRAIPRLRRTIPRLVYVIAGEGPHEAALRRLAGEIGVNDCVRFLGRIQAQDLPGLYAASDVFVMPARLRDSDNDVEGFGIVYVEAGACERPVVGGRSGGVEDAIVDGETGFLVDPLDVEAIAATIERLWRDPELRARLGTAGRRRVMAELTWQHFAQRVCAAVREATGEK